MTTNSTGDLNSPTNDDRAIVIAAILFAERGFAGTTLDDISKAAPNIAVRDELRRFSSKSTLAVAVLNAATAGFPFVTFKDNGAESTGLVRIGICCHAVAYRFQHDPVARASLRLKRDAALIDAPIPQPFFIWISLIEEMLTDSAAVGDINPETDTQTAAWMLVATFSGITDLAAISKLGAGIHDRIDLMLGAAFTFMGAADVTTLVRQARELAGH